MDSLRKVREKHKGKLDIFGIHVDGDRAKRDLLEKGVPLFNHLDVGRVASERIPHGFIEETLDVAEKELRGISREDLKEALLKSLPLMDREGYLSVHRSNDVREVLLHVASYVLSELRRLFSGADISDYRGSFCPFCGAPPFVGFLDKEIRARHLVCSICGGIWVYPRVKCVACGSEDQEKLSYFYEESEEFARIYLCDECKGFFKVFDLSLLAYSGDVDFEELYERTLHLDGEAYRRGYRSAYEVLLA